VDDSSPETSQVLKVKEKNGVVSERKPKGGAKRKKDLDRQEGSSRKKARVEASSELPAEAPKPSSSNPRKSTSGGKRRKASAPSLEKEEGSTSIPSPTPKAAPASTSDEVDSMDTEICGMLIECMATSRASSLPISSLYKAVMESRPSLKALRAEKEWQHLFKRVLSREDVSRGGSGVFGKVESSGKDDADRPLESHWFYVPERDPDQERATIIRSMMPRPGKRSETKKYKQYYYQPLAKISRWDPEDAM